MYTGAIGLLSPNGDAVFSVPIRTLAVDAKDGAATFGVGGAITWDSTPDGEYEECCLKAKFLTHPWAEFKLLETMALEEGEYALLDRHLSRARDSARYFGFHWNEAGVVKALDAVCRSNRVGRWRIRLLVERTGETHIEASPLAKVGSFTLINSLRGWMPAKLALS